MLEDSWLIEKLDSIDSSQTFAKKYHKTGQRVILTREQTAGYGQKGRPWTSIPGNLFATLSFPYLGQNHQQITLVAALALGKSLSQIKPDLNYQYKWVNDLLLEGKKFAGILCEAHDERIFLGLGVNLKASPSSNANLASYGLKIFPEELISLFLKNFTEEFNFWISNGFKALAAAWEARAYGLGEEVRLELESGEELTGTFLGLDERGLILLTHGKKISLLACRFLDIV